MSKTAYLFPGQGSQYVGMGYDLYCKYQSARSVYDRADKVLGFPLSKLCFEGPEEELGLTVNAQPALLVTSIAALEAAREASRETARETVRETARETSRETSREMARATAPGALSEPAYMAGHSLGEYTALTAAGAMSFDTAVALVRERGRLMHEAGMEQPGAMAAIIGLSREVLADICSDIGAFIANLNCPGQIVISGAKDAVALVKAMAKERGAKLAMQLQVSGAFHSPLMAHAAQGIRRFIDNAAIYAPKIPIIGNTSALDILTADMVRGELKEQVCNCVRWEDSIRFMISHGVDSFIEFGPGDVLAGLVRRINDNAAVMSIGDNYAIEALGKMEV